MSLSTRIKQLGQLHPRLLGAVLIGLAAYLALPDAMAAPTRFVIAWDLGVVIFLVLILVMIGGATPQTVRVRAQREDERAWVILALVVGAALASMVAIGFVLHAAKELHGAPEIMHVSFAALTILLSWCMTHTMFALHFAHAYYGDWHDAAAPPGAAKRSGGAAKSSGGSGGLGFPGEGRPDYWDFLYFSFVIGMTCQVSDVQVTSRPMRRLALVHGLIAFIFNTVVLALCINLLAGLL